MMFTRTLRFQSKHASLRKLLLDPTFMVVVEKWLLLKGCIAPINWKTGPQQGCRYRQVVVSEGLAVLQKNFNA